MTMSLSRRLGPCKGSVAGLSLMAIMAGAVASAQAVQPGIHVEMLGIRNSTGAVACALFEAPEGFPTEFMRFAANLMMVRVRGAKATCTFEELPPGTYAFAVIHDENRDGKRATDWMGLPKEGYGFPTTPKAQWGRHRLRPSAFPTTDKAWI